MRANLTLISDDKRTVVPEGTKNPLILISSRFVLGERGRLMRHRQSTRFLTPVALTLAGLLVLVGQTARGEGQPYRIGLLAPCSGTSSIVGAAFVETIRTLEDQINSQGGVNGQRIQVLGPSDEAEVHSFQQEGKGKRYADALVYDTRSHKQYTVTACKELVKKNVLAIIGLTGIEETRAAADLLAQQGPVLVTANYGGAVTCSPNRWLFGTGISLESATRRTLDYVRKRGYKRCGFIYHPKGFSGEARKLLMAVASEKGIKGIAEVSVPLNQPNPQQALRDLRRARPQVILSTAYNASLIHRLDQWCSHRSIPLIQVVGGHAIDRMTARKRAPFKVRAKVLAPVSRLRLMDYSGMTEPEAQAAKRLTKLWHSIKYPGWQTFALSDGKLLFSAHTLYKQPPQPSIPGLQGSFELLAGSQSPSPAPGGGSEYLCWVSDRPVTRAGMVDFCASAYDALMLILDAVKAVGRDTEKIRDHIENRKEFVGAAGTYRYSTNRHQGFSEDNMVMAEFRNGKWRAIGE